MSFSERNVPTNSLKTSFFVVADPSFCKHEESTSLDAESSVFSDVTSNKSVVNIFDGVSVSSVPESYSFDESHVLDYCGHGSVCTPGSFVPGRVTDTSMVASPSPSLNLKNVYNEYDKSSQSIVDIFDDCICNNDCMGGKKNHKNANVLWHRSTSEMSNTEKRSPTPREAPTLDVFKTGFSTDKDKDVKMRLLNHSDSRLTFGGSSRSMLDSNCSDHPSMHPKSKSTYLDISGVVTPKLFPRTDGFANNGLWTEQNSTPLLSSYTRSNSFSNNVSKSDVAKLYDSRQSIIIIVKSFIGTGFLFLPKTYQNGGLGFSFFMTLVIFGLSGYCMNLLLASSGSPTSNIMNFGDVGYLYCGKIGRFVVDCSITAVQLGFCSVAAVFIATNIKDLYLVYRNCEIPSSSVSFFVVIFLQLFIHVPMSWIRRLKYLNRALMAADFLILLSIIIIIWQAVSKISSDGFATVYFINRSSWPLMIGSLVYLSEGIGLLLPIRASTEPYVRKNFPKIFTITFGCVTACFIVYAFICSIAYGDHVKEFILMNLPDFWGSYLIQILYSCASIMGYPLSLFPAVKVLEDRTINVFYNVGKHFETCDEKLDSTSADPNKAIEDEEIVPHGFVDVYNTLIQDGDTSSNEDFTEYNKKKDYTCENNKGFLIRNGSDEKVGIQNGKFVFRTGNVKKNNEGDCLSHATATVLHEEKDENALVKAQEARNQMYKRKWIKNGLRTGMVLMTLAVSYFGIQQLDNMIALIGSLLCVPLVFIYPALFHCLHIRNTYRKNESQKGRVEALNIKNYDYMTSFTGSLWRQLIIDYSIIAVGFFLIVFMVWQSIISWRPHAVHLRCDGDVVTSLSVET